MRVPIGVLCQCMAGDCERNEDVSTNAVKAVSEYQAVGVLDVAPAGSCGVAWVVRSAVEWGSVCVRGGWDEAACQCVCVWGRGGSGNK